MNTIIYEGVVFNVVQKTDYFTFAYRELGSEKIEVYWKMGDEIQLQIWFVSLLTLLLAIREYYQALCKEQKGEERGKPSSRERICICS
ncbi:hypothetical protein PC41400_21735 [Paenibacillus chitinolyticus]|uniref:Uncharacterized protein n=1 Tax=Paenibacillus chitinolyticus TaxID=79263 RepID=A0A410X0E8_9BACL|nr:hypothetical protein PC41400_21735 [Paenibacillus chitinolyticus]